MQKIDPEPAQVVELAFHLAEATGEAIDVQAHAGDAIAEKPVTLVQLLIVSNLHRFWPVDERSRDDGQQPDKALAGLWMRPVDFVIERLNGGAIRDEAGVKENAGIVIRKIVLPKALVDLLVQLMLVHGEGRKCVSADTGASRTLVK